MEKAVVAYSKMTDDWWNLQWKFNQNIRKMVGNQSYFLPDLNNYLTSQLHQLDMWVTEESHWSLQLYYVCAQSRTVFIPAKSLIRLVLRNSARYWPPKFTVFVFYAHALREYATTWKRKTIYYNLPLGEKFCSRKLLELLCGTSPF